MIYTKAKECIYRRNHKLWVKRGKPMNNESIEEIEMENEKQCEGCQYYERIDGEMVCNATDEQFWTDDTPCNREEEQSWMK